jgi:NAD(P)-dependent dehydrogenase (short-subunit alcohol dehydrogenase family)
VPAATPAPRQHFCISKSTCAAVRSRAVCDPLRASSATVARSKATPARCFSPLARSGHAPRRSAGRPRSNAVATPSEEAWRQARSETRLAGSRIVFINAARGSHAVPRWSAYTASKSALRDLADSLREEEDRHGVRVTTIYPGGVGTDLLRRVREQFGQLYDPAATVSPRTIASVVLTALEFPDDAHLMDITLRRAPSGGSR